MGLYHRRDPGPCPVCDAPHTICTAPGPALLAIPQLPARDAAALEEPPLVGGVDAPPLVAEIVQTTLPPGQFTSGTYRRKGR
jgi:hypothetical protein